MENFEISTFDLTGRYSSSELHRIFAGRVGFEPTGAFARTG